MIRNQSLRGTRDGERRSSRQRASSRRPAPSRGRIALCTKNSASTTPTRCAPTSPRRTTSRTRRSSNSATSCWNARVPSRSGRTSRARRATPPRAATRPLHPDKRSNDLLTWLGERGVVFDPPYDHQAERTRVRSRACSFRDFVVTTGTGSGKTETFLLPILGRLAAEASARPVVLDARCPRAPALSDERAGQRPTRPPSAVVRWKRCRAVVHRPRRPADEVRPLHGPDPLPGRRKEDTAKHWSRLKAPLEFFTKLEDRAVSDAAARGVDRDLRQREGKWPAKPSSSPERGCRPQAASSDSDLGASPPDSFTLAHSLDSPPLKSALGKSRLVSRGSRADRALAQLSWELRPRDPVPARFPPPLVPTCSLSFQSSQGQLRTIQAGRVPRYAAGAASSAEIGPSIYY